MSTKLTRRAATLSVAAIAMLPAQTQETVSLPANPDEELKAMLDQFRQNSEALHKVDLVMSAEPAFVFKP